MDTSVNRSSFISLSDEVVFFEDNDHSHPVRTKSAVGESTRDAKPIRSAGATPSIYAMHPNFKGPPQIFEPNAQQRVSTPPMKMATQEASKFLFDSTTSVGLGAIRGSDGGDIFRSGRSGIIGDSSEARGSSILLNNLNLSISIPSTSTNTDSGDKFTYYHVEVSSEIKSYTVKKRFREFDVLHNELVKAVQRMEKLQGEENKDKDKDIDIDKDKDKDKDRDQR